MMSNKSDEDDDVAISQNVKKTSIIPNNKFYKTSFIFMPFNTNL